MKKILFLLLFFISSCSYQRFLQNASDIKFQSVVEALREKNILDEKTLYYSQIIFETCKPSTSIAKCCYEIKNNIFICGSGDNTRILTIEYKD